MNIRIPELSTDPVNKSATAYANANIALAKYWGKRDKNLNLPVNSSLSISLAGLGTTTSIECANQDTFSLNNVAHPVAKERLFNWIDRLFDFFSTTTRPPLAVRTSNNIPTGAGLASSASAFAASTKALNDLFDWQLSLRELSILARMGSGSASRSLYTGFAIWHRGEHADGSDSYSDSVSTDWSELAIAVVTVSAEEKAIGSTNGMIQTATTSPLFDSWVSFAQKSFHNIYQAVLDKNFKALGEHAEHNAMTMHATMHSAQPMINYWKKETLDAIDKVTKLRASGIAVFYTLDAGANIKILFEINNITAIEKAFPSAIITIPFS